MSKCTSCEHQGAYVGATEVECPNKDCVYFTERQAADWEKIKDTLPSEHDYHPPQYLWITRHNDFGD